VPSKGKKLPKRPKSDSNKVSDNREPREVGELNKDDASPSEASVDVTAAVDAYGSSEGDSYNNSDAEDSEYNDDSDSDPIETNGKQIGEAECTGPPLP
jgi:hypothetical protein